MDRLDRLRIFLNVTDMGSFTRAADALELPRSTVSAAVRRLEQELGTRLLHRTTRLVRPTVDGGRFAERARRLLAEADALGRMFRTSTAAVDGRLVVDAPSRIVRRIIAPALPGLLRQYPKLSLHLGSSDRSINLVREGVDCVIRVGAVRDDSLVARPLGHMALVNCASADYLREHGVPQTLDDLAHHLVVGYAASAAGRTLPWDYLDAAGQAHAAELASRLVVNNVESYLACCRAGLGLIQIPRYDVADLLASGELVEVLPELRPRPMDIAILYPHRGQRSPRLLAFMTWFEALMRPHLAA